MSETVLRPATGADLAVLETLWRELEAELGGPEHVLETWEEERPDLVANLRDGLVLIAEAAGETVGYAEAGFENPRAAWLKAVYVRPAWRSRGVGRALIGAVAAEARVRGHRHLTLDTLIGNARAQLLYERLGFATFQVSMAVSVPELEQRLSAGEAGPTHGAVYVQTDDEAMVERAARQFVPRLGRSASTEVRLPVNGWTRVDDELCSREPRLLRRLGQELSYRTGGVVVSLGVEEGAVVRYVLFDRGSVADEYASVPEYHGPLPPGDVIAMSANATVVHRLTGADPERVRTVARNAASPSELPPADVLLAELVSVLGLE